MEYLFNETTIPVVPKVVNPIETESGVRFLTDDKINLQNGFVWAVEVMKNNNDQVLVSTSELMVLENLDMDGDNTPLPIPDNNSVIWRSEMVDVDDDEEDALDIHYSNIGEGKETRNIPVEIDIPQNTSLLSTERSRLPILNNVSEKANQSFENQNPDKIIMRNGDMNWLPVGVLGVQKVILSHNCHMKC